MHADGGSKANLYCILRDCWKNLITILVSQNNQKNTTIWAPGRHYTQAASKESLICVGCRRSAWPPLARGPIRRNRSNRLKTGPVCGHLVTKISLEFDRKFRPSFFFGVKVLVRSSLLKLKPLKAVQFAKACCPPNRGMRNACNARSPDTGLFKAYWPVT